MDGDCIHLCPASVGRLPEWKEGGGMWAKIGGGRGEGVKFWEERVWKSYCGVCGCQKRRKKAKIAPYGIKKYRLCCKGVKYNIGEQTFFLVKRLLGKNSAVDRKHVLRKLRHIDTCIIDISVIDIPVIDTCLSNNCKPPKTAYKFTTVPLLQTIYSLYTPRRLTDNKV